jgi:diguanylate cyclase (GGDEF)-like protein
VTASLGVACFPDDAEDKQGLIGAADTALYQAKAAGRNCVRLAPARPKAAGEKK